MKYSHVIKMFRPNPLATHRLFCFPFAGGAASAYKEWADLLYPHIEVCTIQMPGRESRIRDSLLFQVEDLVEDIYKGIIPYLDKPYSFFGHSLGALVSYELTLKLQRNYYRSPQIHFVSGCGAPHVPPKEFIHELPDDEFKSKLMELGGTPQIILESPEIFDIYKPILRADFTMVECYNCQQLKKVNNKIVAYGGSRDDEVTLDELMAWHDYTLGEFKYRVFEGDHFFIRDGLQEIITDMKLHLNIKERKLG